MSHGQLLAAINGGIGAFLLVLPVLGITFTYLLLCRSVGAALAVRRTRREAAHAARNVAPNSPAPAAAPAAASLAAGAASH